jgi:hypothetical protein
VVVVVADGEALHLGHRGLGDGVVRVEERRRLQTFKIGDKETLVGTIVGGLGVREKEKRDKFGE